MSMGYLEPLVYFTLSQKIATITWLLIFWNYYLISTLKPDNRKAPHILFQYECKLVVKENAHLKRKKSRALDQAHSFELQTKILTWSSIAQEARASLFHLHVSAELFTSQNVEKIDIRVRRILWEIRLKNTKYNTHRWKKNGVTFLFCAWLCYI